MTVTAAELSATPRGEKFDVVVQFTDSVSGRVWRREYAWTYTTKGERQAVADLIAADHADSLKADEIEGAREVVRGGGVIPVSVYNTSTELLDALAVGLLNKMRDSDDDPTKYGDLARIAAEVAKFTNEQIAGLPSMAAAGWVSGDVAAARAKLLTYIGGVTGLDHGKGEIV